MFESSWQIVLESNGPTISTGLSKWHPERQTDLCRLEEEEEEMEEGGGSSWHTRDWQLGGALMGLDPKSSNSIVSVKHEFVSTLLEVVLNRQRYFLNFLTLQEVIIEKKSFFQRRNLRFLKTVVLLSSSSSPSHCSCFSLFWSKTRRGSDNLDSFLGGGRRRRSVIYVWSHDRKSPPPSSSSFSPSKFGAKGREKRESYGHWDFVAVGDQGGRTESSQHVLFFF